LIPGRTILLSGFLLLLASPGWSQVRQPHRLEITAKHSDQEYHVISLSQEGLALVRDMNSFDHGKKKWQLLVVDTVLTTVWSMELELESRLSLVGYEHSPGHLFLLFREEETTFHNFQLVNLHLTEQTFQLNKIQFDLNFRLTHFTVAGNSAIFGGYVSSEPAVLLYNQSSDHPKVLPGLFTKGITLLDVRTNQNQSFNVLLAEERQADQSKLILRTFDESGNLLIDDVIDVAPRYTIMTGITSTLIHDEMIIAGTFGIGSGKQASGFYFVAVDPFAEQAITYIDFAALEHFMDYLPEKKARKLRNKASNERLLGKNFSYRASIIPFRVAEFPGGFYLLAEMYHPSTNVNAYPYSNPGWANDFGAYPGPGYPYRSGQYQSPHYRTDPPIRNSEVRLIQSVVLRFRTTTTPPIDFSMNLEGIKKHQLDQTSDFLLASDSLVVAVKKKNEILYQRESNDMDVTAAVDKAFVTLQNPDDIFRDEEENEGGLRFWYGTHFYAWGYQRVKKGATDDFQSRYVFYVNRIDL